MRHALCAFIERYKRNKRYKRNHDGNNSIYETKSRVFTTEAEVEA